MSDETGKPTPGQWLREGAFVYALTQDGWRKGDPNMVNRFSVRVQRGYDCTEAEAESIACKIEALPELLEALKHAVEVIRTHVAEDALGVDGDGEVSWPVKAAYLHHMGLAIAKAEGRVS